MGLLRRLIRALPLLLISPLLLVAVILTLALTDLLWLLLGRRRPPEDAAAPRSITPPSSASVVIPNWNGRDLLEKYLPSVVTAMAGNPRNEIIVVDNGSSDGSADFVRQHFPGVEVLALERNLGFGGGSNAGFRAAANDVVVLLNSDMRVDPGFLPPLLAGFTDNQVFSVSCQIFFSDPHKRREETGLTEAWWQDGWLRVRHRDDPQVRDLYPCFYGGGGSCAYDRRKFLELGGFDHLLAPFYLEDTDIGYLAWKRGWKVFYQPRSIVFHEHRGTIGKRFRPEQIQAVLTKNFLLFCWKNIHEWPRLLSHLLFSYAGVLVSVVFGNEPGRANLGGLWRACCQLFTAARSRWQARRLAMVSDTETFLRPLGGYFRDRFADLPADPERPRVLFVSPYPICPPVHGGGVFMYQTLRELARLCEVHVLSLLDQPSQQEANAELAGFCASVEFLVRMEPGSRALGTLLPHAVREFASEDLAWRIHRQIYQNQIDVLQLEYTHMGQYAGSYRRLLCALFEHDLYFQSIARALAYLPGPVELWKARFEYLRALRYELRLLPRLDQVQVCTRENRDYLLSFLPEIAGRVRDGLRAGIDASRYSFQPCGRLPDTMLFLGSFRHEPNRIALEWFIQEVLPHVRARRPQARLVVVGSDPPARQLHEELPPGVEFLGFVEDIREPLAAYAVFVCPIRSGSGVRVKLLEAYASGIPVVSTRVGAEGLGREDGEFCRLADDPREFAAHVLALFENPQEAAKMAQRAREEVVRNWDMATLTRKLAASYREALRTKRAQA